MPPGDCRMVDSDSSACCWMLIHNASVIFSLLMLISCKRMVVFSFVWCCSRMSPCSFLLWHSMAPSWRCAAILDRIVVVKAMSLESRWLQSLTEHVCWYMMFISCTGLVSERPILHMRLAVFFCEKYKILSKKRILQILLLISSQPPINQICIHRKSDKSDYIYINL